MGDEGLGGVRKIADQAEFLSAAACNLIRVIRVGADDVCSLISDLNDRGLRGKISFAAVVVDVVYLQYSRRLWGWYYSPETRKLNCYRDVVTLVKF